MSPFAEHYQRPDLDAVRARTHALAQACASARTVEELLEAVRAWNRLRATVDTQYSIALVRFNQDTRDPVAKAEQDFWDQATPVMRELAVLHARTLLACDSDSRFAGALDREFGPQLRALKQCEVATFVPVIADAVAEEAALVSEYTELMARPDVKFWGHSINLSSLFRFLEDPDRETRREAHQALDGFMARYAGELDRLFGRLVELRDGMGKALGHASYVPLAYQLRSRLGYGADEVAAFRRAVVSEIVPLAVRIRAQQARDLGVDPLLYHDERVWSSAGNPVLVHQEPEAMVAAAQRMYRELHPEIGEFFDVMVHRGLLDLETRDNKAGGGFCISFADLGVPFIFGNFSGSTGDVITLTHECGHAFQVYASRHLEPKVDYAFPTTEAAEIHSMSMELLAYPWMELFFDDAAAEFRRTHLKRAVCMIPYFVLVDHFQHDAYENPSWSPTERNRRWRELEELYQPERSYGDLYPYLQTGTLWQRQHHIYSSPFYYVDYALAQVCALQLWQQAEHDRDVALAKYLAISRVGGSKSFLEILAMGGLASPFDPACLREVAKTVAAVVDM